METTICKSCGSSVGGQFCSQCGQAVLKTPYNFRSLTDTVLSMFDFDKGYLFTFISLTRKPGWTIGQFLSGDTRRFHNPLRFLFTTIASWVLISWISTSLLDLREPEELRLYLIFIPEIVVLAACNFAVLRERNFVEHLMISTYELALFITIIAVSNILLNQLVFSEPALLFIPAMMAYHIWFTLQVFKIKPVYLVLLALVSFVIFFVVAVVLAMYIPASLEETLGIE